VVQVCVGFAQKPRLGNVAAHRRLEGSLVSQRPVRDPWSGAAGDGPPRGPRKFLGLGRTADVLQTRTRRYPAPTPTRLPNIVATGSMGVGRELSSDALLNVQSTKTTAQVQIGGPLVALFAAAAAPRRSLDQATQGGWPPTRRARGINARRGVGPHRVANRLGLGAAVSGRLEVAGVALEIEVALIHLRQHQDRGNTQFP
jgi:hypothetical protein